MRNFKRLSFVFMVVALLVVPVAALSAQSGALSSDGFGECVNGFLDDGSLIYACGPEGTLPVPVAPSSLPQSGSGGQAVTSAGGFVWDGASDWRGVTSIVGPEALPVTGQSGDIYVPSNLPAPGETELTIGELARSSLAETEPGDIYLASNVLTPGKTALTAGPAPVALPETGSNKIPEPAIKNWRFEGFTLVPDWVGSQQPKTMPVTGSAEQAGTTVGGLVWDGTTYVPDVVSEPPLALPLTGSAGEPGASIVGYIFDGATYVPDIAGSAAP
jgi:hypothetical protein